MPISSKKPGSPLLLGIEGGATHTVALLADATGQCHARLEEGPANIRLLSDAQLLRLLKSIAAKIPRPDAMAIGMAGTRTTTDRERIRDAAARVWPRVPVEATNDLETALAANDSPGGQETRANILILSGTGACCYGRNPAGKTAKVDGWGHLLGDHGSAYDISLRALQMTISVFDHNGVWPKLGSQFLRRLQLNEPNDLIAWIQTADKAAIAGLAPEVFAAAHKNDRIACLILAKAADNLAQNALACARQLAEPNESIHFVLAGGILLHQRAFAVQVTDELLRARPHATVSPLKRESVWGAAKLARQLLNPGSLPPADRSGRSARRGKLFPEENLPVSDGLSPTEQRNPRSRNLDKLPMDAAIVLMLSEEARVPRALLAERKKIAQAVKLIARAFQRGGRLFYVGAGTSGRLGVLDATECPPTFRTPPELVQGIIAGGQTALWRSIEGAEDDSAAGARALEYRGVDRHDVVVGIAASGRTPFVWGALEEAKRRGAATVLLAFNPLLKIPRALQPRLVITPNIGPEVLTGSTRLKAGTATKLILNLFTTLAMARLGKVAGNLMIDLNPSNTKLRARAVSIVRELTGANEVAARNALEQTGWEVKQACDQIKHANRRLKGLPNVRATTAS